MTRETDGVELAKLSHKLLAGKVVDSRFAESGARGGAVVIRVARETTRTNESADQSGGGLHRLYNSDSWPE